MTLARTTSPQGIAFIERKEDVVLKAYRDTVGVWTIGAGLTKGSGVITPKPGMVISREEARTLLEKALARNYEPRVRHAMPGAVANEFDAGVSFDFNTGEIHSASWVRAWIDRDWPDTERRLMLWVKGGRPRKIIPGLVNRRKAEWNLLRNGEYGPAATAGPISPTASKAGIGRTLGHEDVFFAADALRTLGYQKSSDPHPLRDAVEGFQRDHDLTVDGIIGPATLATLRRQMDARKKLTAAAAAGGTGGAIEAAPTPHPSMPDWLGWLVLAAAALWALWLLWQYRDWLAARVQRLLPGVARLLRSV